MSHFPHPAALLHPEWTAIIRDHAAAAEKSGSLHPEQLALIYRQKWFRLFVPGELNGAAFSLPDAVRLEEALAWADGSLGWTVTLCSGAGWFAGYLDPSLAKNIFADQSVCLGGSGAPSGTATKNGDGYTVTGRWKYATGAAHTTHFTANCRILEGNEPAVGPDGKPLILPFVFNRTEVTVIPDWKASGLVATGSYSFEIKEAYVPAERCFKIDPAQVKTPGLVYTYPFLQFAEVTLAANISGMAVHFMDLCASIFEERIRNKGLTDAQKAHLNQTLQQATTRISALRERFHAAIAQSWQLALEGESIPGPLLAGISNHSRNLARTARECTESLYPFCGLVAAEPSSTINRVWRNLHTASQHTLLTFPEG